MSLAIQTYLKSYKVSDTNVYAIPMDVFRSLDIKQWKFNRPPDITRLAEIRSWMTEFKRMDGVLNLAYISGEGLVCFEGNHRRLALDGLDITVFADVLWDVTDEIVVHEFRRLNKSICVPDLYVTENHYAVRENIEKAVQEFRKKYPSMESSSGRPQRPNFNRDKLTDELFRLHKELGISIEDLMVKLNSLNDTLKVSDKSKLSDSIKQKCEKSGLWLFAWNSSINMRN
jgi:hypothetical protein